MLTAAAVVAAPAAAIAAVAPPTVATSFPTDPIAVDSGLGQSTGTVVYTVTNSNSSGTLYDIAFSDTLPAGVAFDKPVTESDANCSSSTPTAPVVSWTISATSITIDVPQVKAGTANACTVQFPIVGTAVGTGSDSYAPGSFTYSTSSTGTPVSNANGTTTASIQVIPEPTVSVSGLKERAVVKYGQSVRVTYSCAQPALPYALTSCTATDDLGHSISSGGKLYTKDPGKHVLDVEVIDAAGDIVDDEIDYTVLANNAFTIVRATPGKGGRLALALSLPGPGRLRLVELDRKHQIASDTTTVRGKGTVRITLSPSKAGAATLGASGAKVKLVITYTPKGGRARTETRRAVRLS